MVNIADKEESGISEVNPDRISTKLSFKNM